MPFCSKCGSVINQGNRFCSKCGAPVEGQITSRSTTVVNQQEIFSLSRQLTELANNIDSLQSVIAQTEKVQAQFQIPEPRKPRVASRWWAMKGFAIGGIVTIAVGFYILLQLLILASSSEIGVGGIIVGIVILFLFIGIGVALIIIGYKTSTPRMENYNRNSMNKYNAEVQRRNSMLMNLQQQYNQLESSKAAIVNRIQTCMLNNGNRIMIPENYFYSEAIRFFADRLATGRANSLAEAMDAYDAHLHRMKLEQAANEAAEYQRQSASNLAAISREQTAMRRQGAVNTALHVANTIRHWN